MSEYVLEQPRSRTSEMVTAALVVALMAAAAWITLPTIGSVPFTLQVFVVVLAALLLSPGWAAAALGLYVALGAIGLPIFSGAKGGIGVLMGPTGGYLTGFVVGVVLGALVRDGLRRQFTPLVGDVAAATVVVVASYLLGALQLAAVAKLGPATAFATGVLPFIGLDAAKAAVAIAVANAVRRARAAGGF